MTPIPSHLESPAAPPYLRPGPIALVVMGGVIGTAIRAWAESSFPPPSGGFPWVTFGINVTGAFLLGVLLEALALLGQRNSKTQPLRLALGTGLLGGYTTYCTFAVETVKLGASDHLVTAAMYAAASLVAGFIAALTAMTLLRRVTRGGHGRWKDHHA